MTADDRDDGTGGRTNVTREVADEGGSPGDVEIEKDERRGIGSEADETWRPDAETTRAHRRDETGEGRRNP